MSFCISETQSQNLWEEKKKKNGKMLYPNTEEKKNLINHHL